MIAPVEQRLFSRVVKGAEGECWIWTGALNEAGYGRIGRGTRSEGLAYTHRLAYELLVGPIPDGLTLDHLCYTPACVNPAHLEPVTHEENIRRAGARITHCKRGHEFTPENTSIRKEGRRGCRQCARDRGVN